MAKKAWPTGIRPSGRGIRIFIYRGGRLEYSETVEGDPYASADLAAAIKRREELKARQRLGMPLTDGEVTEKQSFKALCESYLNAQDAVGIKRSTLSDYYNILSGFWMPEFGTWQAARITAPDILKVLGKWSVSGKTKKNRLGPLSGVLSHAGINPNPVTGIRIRRGQRPHIDRYTPMERDRLLGKLEGQPLVYFSLLFGCGLRPGEALGLTWADYDGAKLQITKQITRRRLSDYTKTSKRRTVRVPTWARAILNQHNTRFSGKHIFLNSHGGPFLDTDTLNDAWADAHRRVRIPYRIPYVCRHTRASELLSTGVAPADAAKELGHSLQMFLTRYAEWIEEFAGGMDESRFEGLPPTKNKQMDMKP